MQDDQERESYRTIMDILEKRSALVYQRRQQAKAIKSAAARQRALMKVSDNEAVVETARAIFAEIGPTYRQKEERIKATFMAARDAGYWTD